MLIASCTTTSSDAHKTAGFQRPQVPSLSARVSGDKIVYSWSGGGAGGLKIAQYELCVDGSCSNVGAKPGSKKVSFKCGQHPTSYAYSVDATGHQSASSPILESAISNCGAASVSISWGQRAPVDICGGDSSCTYLRVSWSGLGPGNHQVSADCASPCGGGTFPTENVRGSSGSLPSFFAVGYCGHAYQVSADVDGTTSNSVLTNQHGC